jgi:U3 small nucleolar RNA-associated protein 19
MRISDLLQLNRIHNRAPRMPGVINPERSSQKRKRATEDISKNSGKSRKAPKTTQKDDQARILALEEQIVDSHEHYDKILHLQKLADRDIENSETAVIAAVTLCRVFCRLIAGERFVKRKDSSEKVIEQVQWLRQRLSDYVQGLSGWLGSPDPGKENTALTLLMRIVKAETSTGRKSGEQVWRTEGSSFTTVVQRLLTETAAEGARQEFVESFVEEHDDVRFYTFLAIKQNLAARKGQAAMAENALDMLAKITGIPESADQLEDWYGSAPDTEKHQLRSLGGHHKGAREAWLAVFQSPLSAEHRKTILAVMNTQILPWFAGHIELLTDFLTDSFNQGGSTALLALNGIFHLMTVKNIDYPEFYTKLYSLLDDKILHSKYRSRFFRLLETFMASTHLPATMIASFIKRLSRLALHAPPGSIVWVIPWVYNMLKQHPPCTFMLHRPYHPAHTIYASQPNYNDEGIDDPFDMKQEDPLSTGAIDSSLWELETLRSHYHPNVATLAKIMGEQFTKRNYQLEDFLDHSYASLIDAELGKQIKKMPVVEWDIPKHIITMEDGAGLNRIGSLLNSACNSSR